MAPTPGPRADSTERNVKTNCRVCGTQDLYLPPVAVAIDAATGSIQTRCGICGSVNSRVLPHRFLPVLLGAGADVIPRGVDAETFAMVLGRDVYGDDRVPTWPTDGAA